MIVLISGGIAVGKTTVAASIARATGGQHLKVRHALADVLGISAGDRVTLQREGAALDQRTQGRWLRDYLLQAIDVSPLTVVVVDALRTRRQTVPLLAELPDCRLAHLLADVSTRRRRYREAAASDQLKASTPFDLAIAHETERGSDELRHLAELEIETDDLSADEVAQQIASTFGLAAMGSH